MDKIKVNLIKSKTRELEGTRADREKRKKDNQRKLLEELGEWKEESVEETNKPTEKPEEDVSHIENLKNMKIPENLEIGKTSTNDELKKLLGAWTRASFYKLASLNKETRETVRELILKRLQELDKEEKRGASATLIESVRQSCKNILSTLKEIGERNGLADAIESAIKSGEAEAETGAETELPTPVENISTQEVDGSAPKEFSTTPKVVVSGIKSPRINLLGNEAKNKSKRWWNPFSKKEKLTQEQEVEKEIENLSPEDRGKTAIGLHNIGFMVEKKKSEWFAKTFDWVSKKGDQKGTLARFTRGLRDSFKKDVDMAEKKIAAGKKAGAVTKLSNIAYLAKNILRPIRLIADATGMSPTGAQRIVMAGSMASARITGAMKEARLANEEVLEKTRIGKAEYGESEEEQKQKELDIKRAEDEAWKIYEEAKKRAGRDGNVSALELKTAYLHEIPKDLQERLKSTSVANGMVQGVLRKHLDFDVNRLNKDIEKIEKDAKLSPEKIEAKKEQLLRRWEKRLTDYDRALTQTGTVDGFAMAARYAEASSKNITRIMTAQTLYLTLDKIWDSLSQALSSQDINSIPVPKDSLSPVEHPSPASIQTETLPTNPTHTLDDMMKNAQGIKSEGVVEINNDAIIQKGEGIEHAFRRQIENNPELAEKLGYKEGMDLRKFSGEAAHRVALDKGCVDKTTGEEIRIKSAGEVAYQLKLENGEIKLDKLKIKGGFVEGDGHEPQFEGDKKEIYKYTEKAPSGGDKNTAMEELGKRMEKKIDAAVEELHTKTTSQIAATEEELREAVIKKMDAADEEGITALYNSVHGLDNAHPEYIFELSQKQLNLLNLYPEFALNTEDLPVDKLMQAIELHQKNISSVLSVYPGENTDDFWKSIKEVSVEKMMSDKFFAYTDADSELQRSFGPFVKYLHKLKELTGLEPRTNIIFRESETNEYYIARALQKVVADGKVEELEASLAK